MGESHANDARPFHHRHLVADMLGLNLTHPRFLLDQVDLGRRDATTCRGDFVKFQDWGVGLVMCKGGPVDYDANFAALWPQQPERRPGRHDAEPLYLGAAFKQPTQLLLTVLDRFLRDVEANPDQVLLVRCADDIERARQAGKVALLMGANRSDWFADSPGILRMFARLGLRMITLNVSGRELGYDGYDITRAGSRLTEVGAGLIETMNQAGILIDLAHTSEPCALDIIATSSKPVVDSHSNPRALEDSPRNTSDAVMRALAARGGVLGIMPPIARPPAEAPYTAIPAAAIDRTLALIGYAVDVMGIDGVGVGTHFNTAILPWLTDALLRAGYSEAETAKLMGGNYRRVLHDVLPAAV